jgi:multiple antibiotic resistance protein
MPLKIQIFTFLFLMLGPFKIIGPFAKITQGADASLIRQIAFRAIIFSSISLLIAAFIGARMMSNFGIPLPILAISGGIILFLVALLNIIKQFSPPPKFEDNMESPTLNMAINPLAFPVIVTPYGIAAVIIFLALSPDLNGKLTVGAVVLGIMLLNLITMLVTRHIYKFLAIVLALLGAILGILQVALGLMVIYNNFRLLLKM